jgi:hypothetical protein
MKFLFSGDPLEGTRYVNETTTSESIFNHLFCFCTIKIFQQYVENTCIYHKKQCILYVSQEIKTNKHNICILKRSQGHNKMSNI